DPVYQGVLEPLLDRGLAPGRCLRGGLLFLLDGFGELGEAVGRIRPAVEQDILYPLEQVLRDLLVDAELAGVDDAHIEPGMDGMVKEGGVHGFADNVVAPKGKGDIADAAGSLAFGKEPF